MDYAEEWQRVKDDPLAAKYWLRKCADYELAKQAGREVYYTDGPEFHADRSYVLPFGPPRWNPLDTASFADKSVTWFSHRTEPRDWLGGMVGIVCMRRDQERQKPSRLIFTYGQPPSATDRIGVRFTARHDQTGAKLGEYEIVGLVVYSPIGEVGRVEGDVPATASLAVNTYK